MYPRFSEVRLARRVGCDVGPDALKLPSPNVLQILSLRRSGGRLVEINRDLITLPNLLPNVPRHGHTIFDSDAVNGNERHNVGRAHPRMCALMFGQVDQLRGL